MTTEAVTTRSMSKDLGECQPTQITSDWNRRYDTYTGAVEYREVANVLAIKVHDAHLRGSDLTDVFEVADSDKPFDIKNGELRVEVKVGWFGMRPKKTWSHLTLKGNWQLLRNYKGKVAHNLGKDPQS